MPSGFANQVLNTSCTVKLVGTVRDKEGDLGKWKQGCDIQHLYFVPISAALFILTDFRACLLSSPAIPLTPYLVPIYCDTPLALPVCIPLDLYDRGEPRLPGVPVAPGSRSCGLSPASFSAAPGTCSLAETL